MALEIEGHTCNIGTTEYNLGLGERRAQAVRDYLVQRGIAPARLSTVTYGEERPARDNSQESTRRLNRRAVLVVHAPHLDSQPLTRPPGSARGRSEDPPVLILHSGLDSF